MKVDNLSVKDVVGLNTDNVKVMFVNDQLQVTVRGLRIDATGNAHVKALFFSASGVLSVAVNDITATVFIGQSFSNDRIHFTAN